MLMMPIQKQKKHQKKVFSPSSPEGSGVVSVHVIGNEELAVLDDRVCNNQLSARVCQEANTKRHQDVSWGLKAPATSQGFVQAQGRGCPYIHTRHQDDEHSDS